MNYFEYGGYYVAIFFLCLAASAAVAAATWARVSPGRAAGAAAGLLTDLSLRAALIGAATVFGAPLVMMFAFPGAAPVILAQLIGIGLLALLAVGAALLASHLVFSRVSTQRGVALLAAAMVGFYGAVGYGMHGLNDHLLERAARLRAAQETAKVARIALQAITLETRQEALRKRLPLEPLTEPYVSVYRCVSPMLLARETSYRAERRWPADEAVVAALTQKNACRIGAASALPGGGLRVTTEDDTLPPWGRKVAREVVPHDPPPPPLELVFLPAPDGEAGVLRWLCTAPHQPHIAQRFHGCGYWTPSPAEIAGAS